MNTDKRILCIGQVFQDFISLRMSSRQEQRPVKESQGLTDAGQQIDYAAELQELQDGMADDEFNRRGC